MADPKSFGWREAAIVLAGIVVGSGGGAPIVASLMRGADTNDTSAMRTDLSAIKDDVSSINDELKTFKGYIQAKLETLKAEIARNTDERIKATNEEYAEKVRGIRNELIDRVERLERKYNAANPFDPITTEAKP